MGKALESDKYPLARFDFLKITKNKKKYSIKGTLTFHGVKHPLTINADISDNGKNISIKGKTAFKLSEYKIKPIKMLFLTVRDRIDIAINATFKKSK
jgi:polyisoprenoid-binding protein YceI